ncbi:MAG: ATP-binding cassette domain-containing protein, partial [Gemmatimonadota bacterium]|nr:ATP-binding cassette domain-containing protein [Gemmatimonadota bacterium]
RSVRERTEEIMERTGLRVPLRPRVEVLGVGDRQRIEILKALLRDPRVLVLDEPTAVLTPEEIRGLFALLEDLADEGRALALVVHKIDEARAVAHRVSVLRSGRTVLTGPRGGHSTPELVRAMVGDDVVDPIALGLSPGSAREKGSAEDEGGTRRRPAGSEGTARRDDGVAPARTDDGAVPHPGDGRESVARLESVWVEDDRGVRVRDVDLRVQAGEVLGIAGVEGNGQRELALVLGGRLAPTDGMARLPERVGYISQDRSSEGLIPDFDLAENVALALHRKPDFSRGAWLRWKGLREAAEEIRVRYRVAAPSIRTRAGALSGGNQQRVIVGREVAMARELLVAENPTRGLDVAAAAFVHDELRRLVDEGVAVVLISTDLDEVLALSHRIMAMASGSLTEVSEGKRSREGIGRLMLSGAGGDG